MVQPYEQTDGAAGDSTLFDAMAITRPDPALLNYYILVSLASVVFFPIVLLPLWIRYQTMRYRFDDDGVAMSWGFFFRREVYLTYGRLQDIHVTRNIVERWMGLAKLPIQTASGSHGATMTIEGIRDAESMRDFLYSKMRGAKDDHDLGEAVVVGEASDQVTTPGIGMPVDGDAGQLLIQIRDELRQLRRLQEQGGRS